MRVWFSHTVKLKSPSNALCRKFRHVGQLCWVADRMTWAVMGTDGRHKGEIPGDHVIAWGKKVSVIL